MAAYDLEENYDTADDAVVYEVDLEEGDLIIFGTDGLFDNMWNDEMEVHIASHIKVIPEQVEPFCRVQALDSCDCRIGPAAGACLSAAHANAPGC